MSRTGHGLRVCALLLLLSALPARASDRHVVVDKPRLRLYVIARTDTLLNVPVCVGRNFGDKQRKGDLRTPEGTFSVSQIQNSKAWEHDFHDGAGMRKGAYGPWFIRLKTPRWSSIGIHGTCFPHTIGTRDSEGCIRLHNRDVEALKELVEPGMKVIVLPDEPALYTCGQSL